MPNVLLAIDPGLQGAFAHFHESGVSFIKMPVVKLDKSTEISPAAVHDIISGIKQTGLRHVFLERALPMAMGSKHAFNYGRGFAAIEIAISTLKIPVTYVEPSKWMKVMLDGIDSNLKAKARCAIAVHRLCPWVEIETSKAGKLHEGMVDALLIGEYGKRILGTQCR